jgi:ectoine hydroxylase-related dioxygenase (phytanoyl-CoA dioxygenase family)
MPLKLSEQERAHWRECGWLVVRNAFSEEIISHFRQCVDAVSQPPGPGERRLHYFEETAAGAAICRTERFLDDHHALRRLITEGTLPALAAGLSGEPMLIYKEKINYKQPGGAGFATHQDATAYPYVQLHVTGLVPVDPMTPENGCLELASFGERERLPCDERGCLTAAAAAALRWQAVPLAPGDVLFFTSYVPHRSGANRTSAARRALYLTYNSAAEGDLRKRYYEARDQYLGADDRHSESISLIGHFQGTATKEHRR